VNAGEKNKIGTIITRMRNQQQRRNKNERLGADFKRLLQLTSVVGNTFVRLLRGPHTSQPAGRCGNGSSLRDQVGNTGGGATIRAVFIFVARSSVDDTLVNSASTSGGQSALGTSAVGSVGFGFCAARYSCGSSAVLWCASFVSLINIR